jgi:hypothetical protein
MAAGWGDVAESECLPTHLNTSHLASFHVHVEAGVKNPVLLLPKGKDPCSVS